MIISIFSLRSHFCDSLERRWRRNEHQSENNEARKKAKMIVAQHCHWWEPATEHTSEIEWDLNLYSPLSSRLCAWFVSFRSPFEYKISVEKIISGHSIYWMGIACYCSEMNILLASCSRFWFQFSELFLSLDKLWRTSFYIHRESGILFSAWFSARERESNSWKLPNNTSLRGDRL